MKLGSLRQTETDGGEGGTIQFRDDSVEVFWTGASRREIKLKRQKLRRINVEGETWKKVRMKDK